jgi:hypothetical protein
MQASTRCHPDGANQLANVHCVPCCVLCSRGHGLDRAAAQRARRVPEQPGVDARQVERVPALRQAPRRLAGLEVLEADGAAGPVAGGGVQGGALGEGHGRERLDGGGRHALRGGGGARLEHVRQCRRHLAERRVHRVHLRDRNRSALV